MEKAYNPKDIETKHYSTWEEKGYFKPRGEGEPFSIVIPPPNVTGVLHMGHALNHTLQDVMARYMRLKGRKVLWVPGTDHAGIATQNVVEKHLQKKGKSRWDLGRDKFVDAVWEWKKEYGGHITNQIRRLGDSVDWSRERFTMDEGCHKAVVAHFVKLYEDGLIYRGKYIINWCPRCETALSDIEVVYEDKDSFIWSFKYPGKDFDGIVVATTRPETMFGDTAVAVHPDDDRYKTLIGKEVRIPETDRWIPIIADEHVDKDFGTGAVKVTPAHDPNDFEIGKRHDLEQILIMDEGAVMNENAPKKYQGMDRHEARKILLKVLEETGELVETKKHANSIGHCYRCNTMIEPYLSPQWFVAMKDLTKEAIKVVKSGDIKITPKRWEKLYFDWMENIRDWCISRQIWWGHQIPVWYCDDHEDKPIVAVKKPVSCPECGSTNLRQDEDVLDTWFSSALWPFSTMGWPDKTDDLKTFYPTSMLITGYDIITFWVSRMITMGLKHTGEIPFKDVYIHGLIRDIDGKKMSKSLGNAMDPLALIDNYGADALRYSLASHATMGGQDIRYSEEKIQSSRNFANKVWNASRFILMGLEDVQGNIESIPEREKLSLADRWILSEFYSTLEKINKAFEDFNFALVTDLIWRFTWDCFCDWYLEMSKIHKEESLPVLMYIQMNILKLLHPFMPFVTEEVWQLFIGTGKIGFESAESIMLASWPEERKEYIEENTNKQVELLTDVIREIRNLRAQKNIPPSKECTITFVTKDHQGDIKAGEEYIQKLAKVEKFDVVEALKEKEGKISTVVRHIEVYLELKGLIDVDQERNRLEKQLAGIEAEIVSVTQKLSNDKFIQNAPEDVVNKVKEKQEKLQREKVLIQQQIGQLG